MTSLRGAIAFLTPVGGAAAPSPSSLAWFPVVGAAIGALVGGVWWVAGRELPAAVAAFLAVAADLAATGMLHVDGLCDAADGLLPPLDPERRLAVMADPSTGAFAVAACVVVLALRGTAFASVRPSVLLVAALWTASRTWMALAATVLPYARPGGLASAFRGERQHGVAIACGGLVLACALGAAWRPLLGPFAVACGTAGAAAVLWLAMRRLGGYTGDVLGAAGVIGETVGLVIACAR